MGGISDDRVSVNKSGPLSLNEAPDHVMWDVRRAFTLHCGRLFRRRPFSGDDDAIVLSMRSQSRQEMVRGAFLSAIQCTSLPARILINAASLKWGN